MQKDASFKVKNDVKTSIKNDIKINIKIIAFLPNMAYLLPKNVDRSFIITDLLYLF